MAHQTASLVIIFCILLGSHRFPSRSLAARILADDGHGKIGVGGSTPKRDGSWNGNSSPSGDVLLSPPTTVVYIATSPPTAQYVTAQGGQPNTSPKTITVAPTDANGTKSDQSSGQRP